MAKKESKSGSANAALKSDHRKAKAPARESERAHMRMRSEKRAQQYWAIEEETFYIADYGNAV